jgi:hypothetical protein
MDLTLPRIEPKEVFRRKIIKKSIFNFGKTKEIARLRLLRRRSNIFLLLEDLKKKLVVFKTAGLIDIGRAKRRKRDPQIIPLLFKAIYAHIRLYKIKKLVIILNTRFSSCYYMLFRVVEQYNLKVIKIYIQKRIPFNRSRGQKVRRV